MGARFVLIIGIFAFLYGGLAVRFYEVQVKKGSTFASAAEDRFKTLLPVRGGIFVTDKSGIDIPVAIKKEYPYVYCVPQELNKAGVDIKESAARLAEVLGIPEEGIIAKMSKANDPHEDLTKAIPDDMVAKVEELNIVGVKIGKISKRFYPYETLAAHILGFVSREDDKGKYGLESFYEDLLSGKEGEAEGDRFIAPLDGQDIKLTIDQNIQARAERILEDAVSDYKAKRGLVIVMDPKTGAVLAMAGAPSFDPNKYGESELGNFLNYSTQAVYEPGSVFKIVTMASAIDSGAVTPTTTYIDNGFITVNGKTIRNWDHKAHGKLTMTEVIEQSINTGTAFAERTMGHDKFKSYIDKFGFNDKTGIDLPGEQIGDTRTLNNGAEINYVTASYGQGISVTPIRMLSAVNAIANKGVIMKPHLLRKKSEEMNSPISADTAKKMTDIMVSAVVKNRIAAIEGYSVAGKTGTAFVPEKGKYSDNVINTYVGFAPAYDPKFSILIRIDEPEGAPLAGQSVVPAFRELTDFMLAYFNIPPDKVESAR